MYCIVLYSTVMYSMVLYSTVMYCIVLCSTAMYCVVLYSIVMREAAAVPVAGGHRVYGTSHPAPVEDYL